MVILLVVKKCCELLYSMLGVCQQEVSIFQFPIILCLVPNFCINTLGRSACSREHFTTAIYLVLEVGVGRRGGNRVSYGE